MLDAEKFYAMKSVFTRLLGCFEGCASLSPAPSAWNTCSKNSVHVAGDGPVQRGVRNQAAESGRGYQYTAKEQGRHGQGLERVPRSADGCQAQSQAPIRPHIDRQLQLQAMAMTLGDSGFLC